MLISLLLTIFSPLAVSAYASVAPLIPTVTDEPENQIRCVADGVDYNGSFILINDTSYVSLREFSDFVGGTVVSWDGQTSTASVRSKDLSLSVKADSELIEANGRALWCEYGSFISDGRIYVPLRVTARAFGFDCCYDADNKTVFLTRKEAAIESGDSFYNADELYWLSRIINAEAGAEPFYGKLAVGSVIVNRTRSDEFPDGIVEVIFDTENGVQFSPVSNGTIYDSPDEDSVIAAKLTLEGVSVSDDAIYFLNIELAKSLWIVNNCRYVMTIGSHDFYA